MAEDNQTSDFGPLENSEGGRDGDVDVGGFDGEDFESAVCNCLILHQALAIRRPCYIGHPSGHAPYSDLNR